MKGMEWMGLLAVVLLLGCALPGDSGKAYAEFDRVLAKYGLGKDAIMPGARIDVLGFEAEMTQVKALATAAGGSREGKALANAADLELDTAAAVQKMLEAREPLKVAGILSPDCSKDGAVGQAKAAFDEAGTKARLALEKKQLLAKDYAEFLDRFPNISGKDFDDYLVYLVAVNAAASNQLALRCKK